MSVTRSQIKIVPGGTPDPNQVFGEMSFYDEDGQPVTVVTEEGGLSDDPVVTGSAIGTVGKTTSAPEPAANSLVFVKFTNGNSASSPTLAFDGGTARAIQLGGTAVTDAKLAVAAGGVAVFFFDGTILHQVGAYT